MLSRFSCVWLSATLWTVACQVPLSMAFSGKNSGVGCHAPLLGIFLTQGLNLHLLSFLHGQAGRHLGSEQIFALDVWLGKVNDYFMSWFPAFKDTDSTCLLGWWWISKEVMQAKSMAQHRADSYNSAHSQLLNVIIFYLITSMDVSKAVCWWEQLCQSSTNYGFSYSWSWHFFTDDLLCLNIVFSWVQAWTPSCPISSTVIKVWKVLVSKLGLWQKLKERLVKGHSEGEGSLAGCSSCKESDTTELLNSNSKGEVIFKIVCGKKWCGIWNVERWYWWTDLQVRNRDANVESGIVDTAREGEGRTNWESSVDIYILPCVKQIASEKLPSNTGS